MPYYAAIGKTGRCIVARLRPGTDLLTGLKELAEANGLKAAYIPVIIGGVDRAIIEVARPSKDSPVGVWPRRSSSPAPSPSAGLRA